MTGNELTARDDNTRLGCLLRVAIPVYFVAGAEPPKPAPPEKIIRSILADKPRVTRFNIEDWS
jgi:hypothetical protein